MTTPNKTSPTSGALWAIALSLAVIAACLVVLVTRQQRQREAESAQVENVPPSPSKPADTRKLPKSFVVSPGKRETPEIAPNAETSVHDLEFIPQTQPTGEPPPPPEPKVSSGLAPLTYLAATNSPDSKSPASIRGRVTLNGAAPLENVFVMDPQCGKMHGGITNTTRFYAVSKDGGLAEVFVFISSGLKGQKFAVPTAPVVLNQKGCFYTPYVFGMMAGQKLVIKNSDPFLHNVHSEPQMRGNEAFNLAESPATTITKTFRTTEIPVRLRCNIHPWMLAYACVVDHPFFAVTDTNGNFVISNVPPGDYVLEAYHRKTHGTRVGQTQDITVTAGQATAVNFTIQSPVPNNGIAGQR